MSKHRCILCALAIVCLSFSARAAEPEALTKRMVIVSIDGLRPDLLLRANAPAIRGMLSHSTFTFWARTTPQANTLPSHTSMLTGVIPRKHEIEWNRDLELARAVYPKSPTIFEVAKRAGFTTALAAGKSKFKVLAKPGTVDWCYLPDGAKSEDGDVIAHALTMIREHQPAVLFVHLPSVDNAGHKYGWSSPEQLEAIAGADAAVKQLLSVLDEMNLRGSTVVLITADHGGAGRTHVPDDFRARYIPWLISGPGIRKNLDLTIYEKTAIDTEDTFATACYLLGIPRDAKLDGKPILEILERPTELLMSE